MAGKRQTRSGGRSRRTITLSPVQLQGRQRVLVPGPELQAAEARVKAAQERYSRQIQRERQRRIDTAAQRFRIDHARQLGTKPLTPEDLPDDVILDYLVRLSPYERGQITRRLKLWRRDYLDYTTRYKIDEGEVKYAHWREWHEVVAEVIERTGTERERAQALFYYH